MSGADMTRWFKSGSTPARVGVYRTSSGAATYQHWNGRFWGLYMPTVDRAFAFRHERSNEQTPRWRGLAADPRAKS